MGVVSALMVVVPGTLVVWIFTHRRLRGVRYHGDTSRHTRDTSHDVTAPRGREYLEKSQTKPDWTFFDSTYIEESAANKDIDLISQSFFDKKTNMLSGAGAGHRNNSYFDKLSANNDDTASTSVWFLKNLLTDLKNVTVEEEEEKGDDMTDYRDDASLSGHKDTGFMLPWWAVFVAYSIIMAAILASGTVTLFYSLQWGGEKSLQWMLSIFLSASSSTFIVEPLKVKRSFFLPFSLFLFFFFFLYAFVRFVF